MKGTKIYRIKENKVNQYIYIHGKKKKIHFNSESEKKDITRHSLLQYNYLSQRFYVALLFKL